MCPIYIILYGTHKKMPFTNNYPHMGHTERIRIPNNCVSHIKRILEHYDRLYGTHNEEFVHNIQNKIEDGLDNIN